MTSPIKDEEIEALYKQSANEQPSPEIDDAILNYANKSSNRDQVVKSTWNWRSVLAVAATVVFVTLLAPWKWVDDTVHESLEVESMMDDSLMIEERYDLTPEAAPAADVPEQPQSFLKSLPKKPESSQRMMAEALESHTETSPFLKTEMLLKAGKADEARKALSLLLEEQPELKDQLPEHLKALLESD